MNKETIHVGDIGIDAGLCWIGDPCYVLPEDRSQNVGKDWEAFCSELGDHHPTMKSFKYNAGHEGVGCCVETGYGDGTYPVYATVIDDPQWGQRVSKVEIIFIDEEEDL